MLEWAHSCMTSVVYCKQWFHLFVPLFKEIVQQKNASKILRNFYIRLGSVVCLADMKEHIHMLSSPKIQGL